MRPVRIKIALVGDKDSGKTCLLSVYGSNKFPNKYAPRTYENYAYETFLDGNKIELYICDTIDDKEYDSLRPLSYPDIDLFLLCFSISSPKSLNSIKNKWAPEIKQYCPSRPIFLIGNKMDLRNDEKTRKELLKLGQEPVKRAQGTSMADKIEAYGYFECSAKTKEGVENVFDASIRAVISLKKPKKNNCKIL